jgi:hypothetical protein
MSAALAVAALGACAAAPRAPVASTASPDPYTATYEVDANSMVPILMDATHSQNMRLAVVEQSKDFDRARFVVVPDNGAPGDATALVIHLDQARGTEQFKTCFGPCRSWVHVTPIGDTAEAQARAASLMASISDHTAYARYKTGGR